MIAWQSSKAFQQRDSIQISLKYINCRANDRKTICFGLGYFAQYASICSTKQVRDIWIEWKLLRFLLIITTGIARTFYSGDQVLCLREK